ncbi:MAG: helix-turn-helix domain-containing protein [Eubacteriales bacterium]|nr:helix-turn-helix domain-containing protein [Eubacteriales bacterium]
MSSLYESAKKIADTFEKACCINCFLVDIDQQDGLSERAENVFCAVCSREQQKRKNELVCENIHRHGIFQAVIWGGKYEYLCPAGLAFICTALQQGGEVRYGITAGPFLMVDLADFIEEDLDRFFGGVTIKSLAARAEELPYFYSGRVSYLADILSIAASYAAERESFQLRVMEQVAKSQNDVFYSLSKITDAQDGYIYPIEQEKLLHGYIAQGDKPASQKILNDILGHIFFSSGGDFEYIKARIIELIVILSRAAIEGGADIAEVFGLNHDYIKDVQNFKSLNELNQWLAKVLIRFTSSVFDFSMTKHSDLIKRVITYIRKNYMNKISLNDISDYTKLSVSYLSKIFKEQTDENLSAYINHVRIEHAKMFLLDDSIPLVEVAYLSGFEDQSYFSKVFKKVAKVTPGKYREKKGQI